MPWFGFDREIMSILKAPFFSFLNHSWVVKPQDVEDHKEADFVLGLKPQVKAAQVLVGR